MNKIFGEGADDIRLLIEVMELVLPNFMFTLFKFLYTISFNFVYEIYKISCKHYLLLLTVFRVN